MKTNFSMATAALAASVVMICLAVVAGCSGCPITVNGVAIAGDELESEYERRVSMLEEESPEELDGDSGEKLKGEIRKQVASDLIRAELIDQQAGEMGVEIPADEVNERFEDERNTVGAEEFDSQLAEQGISGEDYKRRIREQVLIEELGNRISSDVTVGDDEVESFYLTNKDLFSKSRMIRAAHILVETEGQAKMVLEQIKSGDDFETLAKSVSKDITSRENGGDLGWIEEGTMDPAFEEAAFALATGEMSEVVECADGFHIIKVYERRDSHTPSFEEVRDRARVTLINRRKEEAFADWLRTVYANADVEVDPSVGKWDPLTGMVI